MALGDTGQAEPEPGGGVWHFWERHSQGLHNQAPWLWPSGWVQGCVCKRYVKATLWKQRRVSHLATLGGPEATVSEPSDPTHQPLVGDQLGSAAASGARLREFAPLAAPAWPLQPCPPASPTAYPSTPAPAPAGEMDWPLSPPVPFRKEPHLPSAHGKQRSCATKIIASLLLHPPVPRTTLLPSKRRCQFPVEPSRNSLFISKHLGVHSVNNNSVIIHIVRAFVVVVVYLLCEGCLESIPPCRRKSSGRSAGFFLDSLVVWARFRPCAQNAPYSCSSSAGAALRGSCPKCTKQGRTLLVCVVSRLQRLHGRCAACPCEGAAVCRLHPEKRRARPKGRPVCWAVPPRPSERCLSRRVLSASLENEN